MKMVGGLCSDLCDGCGEKSMSFANLVPVCAVDGYKCRRRLERMKWDSEVCYRGWIEDGDGLDDSVGTEMERGMSPESRCLSDRRIFVFCSIRV